MRTPHIIIGAALMAAFVIGCSKSSNETPTIRFLGYVDDAGRVGGTSQATFEFKNPSASLIFCATQIQPGGHNAIISIQPNSTKRVILRVGQTNAEALSVTVMRVVSSRELSVPMPNTALEPMRGVP